MTTFKEYVKGHSEAIYSKIMEYLPMKDPQEHYKMVRDYSERQGSYRRPGLVMLTGQMFGATPEDLVPTAAAMQMSEDWILIHDDIEDDSELRRGKPALHKIYGPELAINAGDAVHIAMWKLLKDNIKTLGSSRGGKVFDKFYDMLEYTVEGQYVETNFIYNTHSLAQATEELYYRIVQGKTSYYSVYGPMQLGAIAAGAKKSNLKMLQNIGTPAGIAFQIMDDVLDMTADEKTFGKKRYGDLYEGKLTLIMLHAYNKATPEEKARVDQIYNKRRGDKSEGEIIFLAGLAEKYKSIEYAKSQAEKFGEKAKRAAEKYSARLPNNSMKEVLFSSIEEMYKREK